MLSEESRSDAVDPVAVLCVGGVEAGLGPLQLWLNPPLGEVSHVSSGEPATFGNEWRNLVRIEFDPVPVEEDLDTAPPLRWTLVVHPAPGMLIGLERGDVPKGIRDVIDRVARSDEVPVEDGDGPIVSPHHVPRPEVVVNQAPLLRGGESPPIFVRDRIRAQRVMQRSEEPAELPESLVVEDRSPPVSARASRNEPEPFPSFVVAERLRDERVAVSVQPRQQTLNGWRPRAERPMHDAVDEEDGTMWCVVEDNGVCGDVVHAVDVVSPRLSPTCRCVEPRIMPARERPRRSQVDDRSGYSPGGGVRGRPRPEAAYRHFDAVLGISWPRSRGAG